ncbi:MAG: RecQ family ATP-dependent DNA helicase [Candidatus Auribacterota bacterium]
MLSSQTTPQELLKTHFGYSHFLPGQEEVVNRIIKGENLLVIMPTGGGKSLCYQLPALHFEGVVLVVSPLIALMKDQVDQLSATGMKSTFINSSISANEITVRLEEIASGKYKLVYVAPERFFSRTFLYSLKNIRIDLFAVDEAHCISEWGHDFRPSYMRLKKVADFLGVRSIVALTATATEKVRADIRGLLGFQPHEEIVTGFHRPNLILMVHRIDKEKKRVENLQQIVRKITGSIIVYAGTRKSVESIFSALNEIGESCTLYHAGLIDEDRVRNQDDFINGRKRIIICTNAFGMGINKKDVRAVIHFNMPGSLEAYYQEAGRAGRDGKNSYCIMLFGARDRYLQEFFIQGSYPPKELISRLYTILNEENEDVILKTHEDLLSKIDGRVNEMAVSSVLRIFEEYGIAERLSERDHKASLKLLADFEEAVDSVDPRAEVQRLILGNLIDLYDQSLYRGVQFSLDSLAVECSIGKESLMRGIKELQKKEVIEYTAPFRGRGIRLLKRDLDPSDLPIEFDELEKRADHEFDRLKKVEEYAYNNVCRHKFLLQYFGEANMNAHVCKSCDSCLKSTSSTISNKQESPHNSSDDNLSLMEKAFLHTIRMYSNKFGQKVFVDILKGSQNKIVKRWKLSGSSFYGYGESYSRDELDNILSSLIVNGLVIRSGGMYPVLRLADAGEQHIGCTGSEESMKQDIHKQKQEADKTKNETIIKAVVTHGFDDPKLLKQELGDSYSLAEINKVIMQMKSECLDYLRKRYIREDA